MIKKILIITTILLFSFFPFLLQAGTIKISWEPPESVESLTYNVYVKTGSNIFRHHTEVPRYEFEWVSGNTAIQLWVTALDACGNESAKSDIVKKLRPIVAPVSDLISTER